MAQNMFDESNVNLFDSFKLKARNKQNSVDTDSNFKNSKRSNCSNNTDNNKDSTLKEIRETKSKTAQPNTPAMYRIALRLKRLTDLKIKKSNSGTNFGSNNSNLNEVKKDKILTKQKASIEVIEDNFITKLSKL